MLFVKACMLGVFADIRRDVRGEKRKRKEGVQRRGIVI